MALFFQLLVWLFAQTSRSLPDVSTRRDLQSYPWELDLPSLPGTCDDATKTFNALFFEATEKCQEVISIITPPAVCKTNSGQCPPGLGFDCQDFDVFQETCGVSETACLRNYSNELRDTLQAVVFIWDAVATGGVSSWAGWFAGKAFSLLSGATTANDIRKMLQYGEAMAEFKLGFRRLFKENPDLLMQIVQYQFDHAEPGRFVAPWHEVDRYTQEVILATACRREADRSLRLIDQETLLRQLTQNPTLAHNREETLQSIEDAKKAGEIADDVLEVFGEYLEKVPDYTDGLGFVETVSGKFLGLVGKGASALSEAEAGVFIGRTYAEVSQFIDGEWTGNQASCFDTFTNNNHEFNNQLQDCAEKAFLGLSFIDPTGISSLAGLFLDADQCPNFQSTTDPKYNPRSTLSTNHPWHIIKEDVSSRLNTDFGSIPLFQSFYADSRGDGESLFHQVKNKLLSKACPNDSTKFSKGVCRPMSQTLQTTDSEEDFIWAMLQDTRTQVAFSPQIEKDQCCDKEGSQLIDNFAECLDAFINLQIPYTTWGGKISDPTRPGGCILDVRTDVVRFNTNFEHKRVRGLDEPLCKRGKNTFTTQFTPIAEIRGFVMGARGQGCPDQQVIVQEKDCEYALRMFTRNRPDGATVERSLKDDIDYPVGCTLNLGKEGIYNDFHAFADSAADTFRFATDSYPVCYKQGVRVQNSITPKNHYRTEDCHFFQKNFDHDDCPRGYRLHRLERCGWLDSGNKPVCVRTELVCSKGGNRVELREVNGIKASVCLGRTDYGEFNDWRPSQSQSQIPCDSPSCASKLQCARENESCSCQGTVQYGWGRRWESREVDGSIECNNAVFSDPAPNQQKICTCTTFFKFRLRGRSGNAQVSIRYPPDFKSQKVTLSKEWTDLKSPSEAFTVSFNDGDNQGVEFGADFGSEIQSHLWRDWKCETQNEDPRCESARRGQFTDWRATYVVKLGKKCDWQCYLANNGDLVSAFGATGVAKAEQHWKTNGMREGRSCTCKNRRKL